ncbi:hypothetical protein GEMRC1_005976 [Eukaryota sp. GEM-RC1]
MQTDSHYLLDDPPKKKGSSTIIIIVVVCVVLLAIAAVVFLFTGDSSQGQVLSFSADTTEELLSGAMVVNIDSDILLLKANISSIGDGEPGLLLDGKTSEIWSIGHDICSVAHAIVGTDDDIFYAHDLLLTDDHIQTNETYKSRAGECSWFNATSNHLCMKKDTYMLSAVLKKEKRIAWN